MRTVRRLRPLLLLSAVACVSAAPPPAWTLQPSASARLGYDDNVFLQDRSPILPGVAGAVPDRAGSWIARASASLDFSWKPSPAFQFDAGYSPELVRYEAFSSENHADHRLDLGLRGKQGPWSHQLKAGLVLVEGADDSPVYGHAGGGPAIGGVGVRSRRDQLNTRLGGQLRRDFGGGFLRAAGDVCINDFGTRHADTAVVPGYANYVDRSEWTAGVDAGRRVSKNLTLFTGVRGGEQRQDNLLGVSHNYGNTLTRFLIGIEGKPARTLTLRLAGGPDRRHYGTDVAAGFDRTRTARYLEASATWTPADTDTVTFTGKDYLWLSAGGRCAYQHTAGNLRWTHTFNSDWSTALAADIQAGDSRNYSTPASYRLDWIHTGTFAVTRNLGAKTALDLELTREWSDSAISAKPGREYTRWLASAGIRHVF